MRTRLAGWSIWKGVAMEDRVLDPEKVKEAIDEVLEAYVRLEITVTEAIKATKAVDASLKAVYPELYGLLENAEGADK